MTKLIRKIECLFGHVNLAPVGKVMGRGIVAFPCRHCGGEKRIRKAGWMPPS